MKEVQMLLIRIIENPLHLIVGFLIVAMAVGTGILSFVLEIKGIPWFSSFFQNLSSEMCGSLVIFFLIELFLTYGRDLQSLNQELRSRNKDMARLAIERTRMNGMLFDGSLINQYFGGANWEDADLSDAVLSHASLIQVNLKGANLKGAKVDDVDFSFVDLDENTILPDGTHWAPNIDIMKYSRK